MLLRPHAGNDDRLSCWVDRIRAADLPHLHAFTPAWNRVHAAVNAALTLPYSNGPTETKTKRIARQMHGSAGLNLLRHRILLG